jgi:hypothetical protein
MVNSPILFSFPFFLLFFLDVSSFQFLASLDLMSVFTALGPVAFGQDCYWQE